MIGETVTIVRPAVTVDRYNTPGLDWTSPTTIAVDGCAVAPRTSSEENIGRTAVIVGLTVYAPAGTDFRPDDRLIVRGVTYEIDGEAGDWRNPYTGSNPGVEVAIKRVAG